MDKYAAQVAAVHHQEHDAQSTSPPLELDQIDPFLVHFGDDDDDVHNHNDEHHLFDHQAHHPLLLHTAHSPVADERAISKTMSMMNGTHSTIPALQNGDSISASAAPVTASAPGESTLLPTLNGSKQNGVAATATTTASAAGDDDRTRDFGELLDAINLGNSSSINGPTLSTPAALDPPSNTTVKHDAPRWKGSNETDSRHRQSQQVGHSFSNQLRVF
jgi:hypothetical protein